MGKSSKDYVKLKLEPFSTDQNNRCYFITPKHSNKTITLDEFYNAVQRNAVTKGFESTIWGKSTFLFELKPNRYFTISSVTISDNTRWAYWMYDKEGMANTEGAPIVLKGFRDDQHLMDWGASGFGQWRLTPTGEPVKD